MIIQKLFYIQKNVAAFHETRRVFSDFYNIYARSSLENINLSLLSTYLGSPCHTSKNVEFFNLYNSKIPHIANRGHDCGSNILIQIEFMQAFQIV